MIYVHRHTHEWWPTSQSLHDSRIYRCRVCGDRAYKSAYDDAPQVDAPGDGRVA